MTIIQPQKPPDIKPDKCRTGQVPTEVGNDSRRGSFLTSVD